MSRATLGTFTVDTERDAELIALFEKAKAEGRAQSDVFREMGRVYSEKNNVNETILMYLRSITDSLEEMKIRLYCSGAIPVEKQAQPQQNGLSKKSRGRLRNLGTVEEGNE